MANREDNVFNQVEGKEVDALILAARELIRQQQRRDSLFRLNILIILAVFMLIGDFYRSYRVEYQIKQNREKIECQLNSKPSANS